MKRLLIGVAALAIGTTTIIPTAAEAHGWANLTSGRFEMLPGGEQLGYDIRGRTIMVRSHEHTLVLVRARGLEPNTTYPAHVHDAPCDADPPGGGHYQHDVGGPVDDQNEIWPTVTARRNGRGFGIAFHDEVARPDARAVVIHHPPDTSIRLACVDLE